MVVIAAWEERLAREHLRENAADRPDVNGLQNPNDLEFA